MKRIALSFLLIGLFFLSPLTAFASEYEPLPIDEGAGIAITVVVPRPEINRPIQTSEPEVFHIYPIHVWESRENGRREIIRVYELSNNENPAHILREPFERDGFRFELAEIVRREVPAHSTREHVEVVEISTQTNDLASVIRLLAPSIDYLNDDGYFGVLALDVSSIQIESQGTTSSNFTATRTREFPHLSSADTSLVPRTITDGGRTYNLTNVEWRTQGTDAVDYRQVASTFTAVATYSRVGTRTATIGYTTTAEYRGQISRISVGRTEFTVHFLGIPIVTPVLGVEQVSQEEIATIPSKDTAEVTELAPEPMPAVVESVTVEHVHIGGIVIEAEHIVTPISEDVAEGAYKYASTEYETEDDEMGGFPVKNILLVLLFVSGMVFAYFVGKKGKAMLASMKKASCFLLALLMVLGMSTAVYAVELPSNSFGRQNNDSPAVHICERVTGRAGANNSAEIHFHPSVAGDYVASVMQFNPSASNGTRASPDIHHSSGSQSPYSYGETIGTLIVERSGRTINVIAGATMEAMDFGAGWFSFSGLNTGNTALIGHNRGRTNGFFDFVRLLQEGDVVTLEAGGMVRSYVASMFYVIDAYDFEPLMQFGDTRLTLITCVEYQRNNRRVAVLFPAD